MKTVVIEDIRPDNDYGLIVQMPEEGNVYQDDYFYWKGSLIPACFQTKRISTGTMKTWHRDPVFQKLEFHEDYEKFVFLTGTALFPVADTRDGAVCDESFRVLRVSPGTEVLVPPGKAHFMPIAERDEPVRITVVCPEMPFYHVFLSEAVRAEVKE